MSSKIICPYCNGNDLDMPCAYPGEGQPGCLRDKRFLIEKIRHGLEMQTKLNLRWAGKPDKTKVTYDGHNYIVSIPYLQEGEE